MITLRDLSKSDRAIGAITGDECRMIAAVLDLAASSRLIRLCLPAAYRHNKLAFRMLAATLSRTPAERLPGLNEQIRLAMVRDRVAE